MTKKDQQQHIYVNIYDINTVALNKLMATYIRILAIAAARAFFFSSFSFLPMISTIFNRFYSFQSNNYSFDNYLIHKQSKIKIEKQQQQK